MDYQSRKTLIDQLQALELKYDVHLWKIEGVHIWPILKKTIFFYHFKKSNPAKIEKSSKKHSIKGTIQSMLNKYRAFFNVYFSNVPKSDVVFSGAPSHRINYNGEFINRYFDPMMDELDVSKVLAEYKRLPSRKIYKQDRVIDLSLFLPGFAKKINFDKSWGLLMESEGFSNFLEDLKAQQLIDLGLLKKKVLANLNLVLNWHALFKWFLTKSKAKAAFGLCYYNSQMYGMNLAARELKIPCVDMQHGTQGLFHVAYNIQKHPENGYNILPRHFWVWDELSKKDLEMNYTSYRTIMGGNPSLSYFSNKKFDFEYDNRKPNILITVQPLDEILPSYIYESIRKAHLEYNWWIRLHPRMNQNEINILNHKLKEFEIQDIVKISEVTDLPLAQVLANTDLHISKFSGTIAEATLMNVKTIIIDQIGVDSFQELINQNLAAAHISSKKESFLSLISQLSVSDKKSIDLTFSDYKSLFNEIIK